MLGMAYNVYIQILYGSIDWYTMTKYHYVNRDTLKLSDAALDMWKHGNWTLAEHSP